MTIFQSEFSVKGTTKIFSYTTIIKIFRDQSELSALRAGCAKKDVSVQLINIVDPTISLNSQVLSEYLLGTSSRY